MMKGVEERERGREGGREGAGGKDGRTEEGEYWDSP